VEIEALPKVMGQRGDDAMAWGLGPDELSSEECERLWFEEAARRYEQLKNGTAKSTSSEEVFERLDVRRGRRIERA
jgi:hypothetical protein